MTESDLLREAEAVLRECKPCLRYLMQLDFQPRHLTLFDRLEVVLIKLRNELAARAGVNST